jgi:hypothetical protein
MRGGERTIFIPTSLPELDPTLAVAGYATLPVTLPAPT